MYHPKKICGFDFLFTFVAACGCRPRGALILDTHREVGIKAEMIPLEQSPLFQT
jgi:hypothetical protein